jgi:MoaA/NifB/PqqE/SkfB family radical SAM enzyme
MCDVGIENSSSNFYQNLMGSQPVHMPLELFKKITDQAARYFPKVKMGYAFTEPLTYKYLGESLDYANHKKMFTSVTTNAYNLRSMAALLEEGGLNELYISLDGPPDVHNYIRGRNNSFEKAVEGIDYLLSRPKHPAISVFCVITQWNTGRLAEFLDYFKNKNLSQVGFMHTNYTTPEIAEHHNLLFGNLYPATSSNDVNTEDYNLDELWSEIKRIRSASYKFKITFSPDISDRSTLEKFYREPNKMIGNRCRDILNAIMIKSNGDAIPAHGRCYNLKIGNLYSENLKEIWNSAVVSKFRRDVSRQGGLLPACSRCCSAFSG